jgi:hypothetical protein
MKQTYRAFEGAAAIFCDVIWISGVFPGEFYPLENHKKLLAWCCWWWPSAER